MNYISPKTYKYLLYALIFFMVFSGVVVYAAIEMSGHVEENPINTCLKSCQESCLK
jgi:hypothetical protein